MILTKSDGVALGTRRYSNSRPTVRTQDWNGKTINVEFDKGQTKTGVGDYGQVWRKTYEVPYGEIDGSTSPHDGDAVDCYLGDSSDSADVYVVHQLKRDGSHDEDKCMLGFGDMDSAVAAYVAHGPEWGLGPVDAMTIDQFLNGYLAGARDI